MKAYERQLNDLLSWHQQMMREMALDTTVLLISRWETIYAVQPSPEDSIRDRQIRLLNKRRAQGVLTPAKVITFANDFGYTARVIKRVHPYRYRVQLNNQGESIELSKLDDILSRSEPGHQSHDFGTLDAISSIEHSSGVKQPIVMVSAYHACGTFSSGGEYEL
ncbi:putative phage tail protein [Brevibacillus centrosporus]|uniref:putative phage tail protein n=1 Tax=Brevibacillus centrosporus TaxID=54910 RepID=UPI002E1B11DB|nr:DUF2313 domain-containing protein [Brevibacillus centrosporus]